MGPRKLTRDKTPNKDWNEGATEYFDFSKITLGRDWRGTAKFTTPDNPHYVRVLEHIQGFVRIGQLLHAAANGNKDYLKVNIVKEPVAKLPNIFWQRALHMAVKNRHLKSARVLLTNKPAAIGFRDTTGKTALHIAVTEAVRSGEDIKNGTSKEEETLLANNAIEMVRFLLDKGADINAKDNGGNSAQNLAANRESVRLLFIHRDLLIGPPSNPVRPQLKKPKEPQSREAIMACRGFLATLAEFYTLDGKEKRFLERPTVYEVLYQGGPRDILDDTRDPKVKEKPECCWYHLPANNVSS